MINKIFPRTIENKFPGIRIALYAFLIITLFTIIRSLIHIFTFDGGSGTIASIPLDQFSSQAQNVVILIFAFWGLSQLIIGMLYLIVLIRYKNLIPLMYLLIFLEYLGRFLIGHWKPIETVRIAPGEIGNYILIPLSLILFFLSITNREGRKA